VRQWLKAGVIEDGVLSPTGEGAPQGGVASPLLMNVALHGIEQAAGVRYYRDGTAAPGCPILVRYADSLLKHKVLFGSDWPVIKPDRWLSDFEKLDIKPEVRPLILKENAVKLLGLSAT